MRNNIYKYLIQIYYEHSFNCYTATKQNNEKYKDESLIIF